MRALLVAGLATSFIIAANVMAANVAFGQQPPPPPGAAPPPAVAPPAGAVPKGGPAQGRRLACRADGQARGLRGPELQNFVSVCVEEARLACTKDAAAQNLRGPARRDFMARCLGGA
jgi:hypothetical protein